MDTLETVVKFLKNWKTAIGYIVMAVVAFAGQILFSICAFQCPCSSQNFIYGLTFLSAPALMLFILGFILSRGTWRLFTGSRLSPKKQYCRYQTTQSIFDLTKIIARALVGPLMWVCVSLLNGPYYECALTGWENDSFRSYLCQNKAPSCKSEILRVPCGKANINASDNEDVLLILRAQSQEIGWGLMAFTAIALLLFLCCSACRSHLRYQQEVFWEKYKEKEMEYFQQFSEDYAAKLAEHNLRSFFENKKTDSVPLPSDKAWEEISALHCFNMANQYYSSLHQYVDGEKKENNEDIPSALA